MSSQKYRIVREYEQIYEFKGSSFFFFCSFFEIGADRNDSDETILNKLDDYIYETYLGGES